MMNIAGTSDVWFDTSGDFYSLGAALLYIVAVLGTLDCVSVITYLTAH